MAMAAAAYSVPVLCRLRVPETAIWIPSLGTGMISESLPGPRARATAAGRAWAQSLAVIVVTVGPGSTGHGRRRPPRLSCTDLGLTQVVWLPAGGPARPRRRQGRPRQASLRPNRTAAAARRSMLCCSIGRQGPGPPLRAQLDRCSGPGAVTRAGTQPGKSRQLIDGVSQC